MQKKLVVVPFALAGALIMGCSEDPTAVNGPEGGITSPIDTLPTVPYTDPQTGETYPVYVDPQTGEVTPVSATSSAVVPGSSAVQPGVSSAIVSPNSSGALPVQSSSSQVANPQSSSAGLQEYEDNHKAKATFLPKAGFYSNLTIEPPTPTKGGQIYCTFDGSFPTQGSQQITSAMQITKNTVVRCSEFVNGQPADTTTQTYFIGENVSMPVVALTVNHHDMFDSTDGFYATGPMNQLRCTNPNFNQMSMGGNQTDNNNSKCAEPCYKANFWCEDELPVHVEYFEKGSSTTEKTWEIDAGISLIGNWSRYKPKKSVAIKMDNDDYGDKVLKYSFFKTRPEAKKMKSFNLRNNGNRF